MSDGASRYVVVRPRFIGPGTRSDPKPTAFLNTLYRSTCEWVTSLDAASKYVSYEAAERMAFRAVVETGDPDLIGRLRIFRVRWKREGRKSRWVKKPARKEGLSVRDQSQSNEP